jgi:RecJ-like exonuclease
VIPAERACLGCDGRGFVARYALRTQLGLREPRISPWERVELVCPWCLGSGSVQEAKGGSNPPTGHPVGPGTR